MEQAIGFDGSTQAHTSRAAYAGFREDDLGVLKGGHLADFVILDPDFLHLDAVDDVPGGLVRSVYVDGKKV